MAAKTWSVFKFIFLIQLIDLLAFTLILPLLPKILDYYASHDKSGAYDTFEYMSKGILSKIIKIPETGQQVLLAGFLGSWFSLLQFTSSPFVGALSDQYGRRPILLLCMVGSLASYVIWLAAKENFVLFILSRTIGGLSKATVGLSLAIIGDVSDEDSRGKGMALIGASFSIAFIIGPTIGAYFSTSSRTSDIATQLITIPSVIAISLTMIDILLIYVSLEETNHFKTKSDNQSSFTKSKRQVRGLGHHLDKTLRYINPKQLFSFKLVEQGTRKELSVLRKTGLTYFLYLLFYSGLEFTLSFLTHNRFGFTPMDQGKLYLFSGLIMAIIQGGFVRRLGGRKEFSFALVGLILIVPAFIFMGLSRTVSHIYYSLSLYALSTSMVVPCLTTLVLSHSPSQSKGVVMGTLRSLGALARAIGPCLASSIFWTFGPTTCYILGGIALLSPLYLMQQIRKLLGPQASPSIEPVNKTIKGIIAKAN